MEEKEDARRGQSGCNDSKLMRSKRAADRSNDLGPRSIKPLQMMRAMKPDSMKEVKTGGKPKAWN